MWILVTKQLYCAFILHLSSAQMLGIIYCFSCLFPSFSHPWLQVQTFSTCTILLPTKLARLHIRPLVKASFSSWASFRSISAWNTSSWIRWSMTPRRTTFGRKQSQNKQISKTSSPCLLFNGQMQVLNHSLLTSAGLFKRSIEMLMWEFLTQPS